jgi:hypothetical protein
MKEALYNLFTLGGLVTLQEIAYSAVIVGVAWYLFWDFVGKIKNKRRITK